MKNFILPTRVICSKGEFNNLNNVLVSKVDQPSFAFDLGFEVNNGGSLVLDFGKELSGGLRIVSQVSSSQNNVIHLTFGESVSEVMASVGEFNSTNDHSPREFDYLLPNFSSIEVGNTGFRFVKIDFPKDVHQKIYSINAIEQLLDNELIGKFESDNDELNKIFNVASRTASICVQNYIYDGIKRDRLVWSGDLYNEIKSILYLHGNIKEIEKTFLFLEETNKMPCFVQNMPTYSIWYIACINEYFKYVGKTNFVKERKNYIESILEIVKEAIKEDGLIVYDENSNPSFPYFVDWRTANEESGKYANPSFCLYFLKEAKELFDYLGLSNLSSKTIDKLSIFVPKLLGISQFDCFALLNKTIDSNLVIDSIKKSKESQLSTFSNYFVIKSVFDYDKDLSMSLFKNYHMAMINLSATTFFEEFEYSWKDSIKVDEIPNGKFDMFRDVGSQCYQGLRKSLCHGWASSPVSFIIENIVGFQGVEGNNVLLKPYVADLKEFEASFMCSLGNIKVAYKNNKFNVITPENVEFKILN